MIPAVLRLRQLLSWSVLGLLWGLVITPIGLISRVIRGDVLQTRPDRDAASYWAEPDPHDDGEALWGFFVARGKIWLLPVVLLIVALGVLILASEASVVFAFLYPLF